MPEKREEPGTVAVSAEEIRSERLTSCPACGHRESATVHARLRDRLFGAPGEWSFEECAGCGLVFLDPRPVGPDIGKAYTPRYSSRKAPAPIRPGSLRARILGYLRNGLYARALGYRSGTTAVQRGWGALIAVTPLLRERWLAYVLHVPAQPGGRLLDVGSGVGRMLSTMVELGWNAEGVDTDPRVVEVSRQAGLEVHAGTLESASFDDASFDVITCSHVIEHVDDPFALLTEMARVLKPGGRLYLRTPNTESLGHREFGELWHGLDAPRHLFLFSARTLERGAREAGFSSVEVFSSARPSWVMALTSRELERHGRNAYSSERSLRSRLAAHVFATRVRLRILRGHEVGDELVMHATR